MTAPFDAKRAAELVKELREVHAALPCPLVAEIDVFDSSEGHVATIADAETKLLAIIGTDVPCHRYDDDKPWTAADSAERDRLSALANKSEGMRQAAAIVSLRNHAREVASQLEAAAAEVEEMTRTKAILARTMDEAVRRYVADEAENIKLRAEVARLRDMARVVNEQNDALRTEIAKERAESDTWFKVGERLAKENEEIRTRLAVVEPLLAARGPI